MLFTKNNILLQFDNFFTFKKSFKRFILHYIILIVIKIFNFLYQNYTILYFLFNQVCSKIINIIIELVIIIDNCIKIELFFFIIYNNKISEIIRYFLINCMYCVTSEILKN